MEFAGKMSLFSQREEDACFYQSCITFTPSLTRCTLCIESQVVLQAYCYQKNSGSLTKRIFFCMCHLSWLFAFM